MTNWPRPNQRTLLLGACGATLAAGGLGAFAFGIPVAARTIHVWLPLGLALAIAALLPQEWPLRPTWGRQLLLASGALSATAVGLLAWAPDAGRWTAVVALTFAALAAAAGAAGIGPIVSAAVSAIVLAMPALLAKGVFVSGTDIVVGQAFATDILAGGHVTPRFEEYQNYPMHAIEIGTLSMASGLDVSPAYHLLGILSFLLCVAGLALLVGVRQEPRWNAGIVLFCALPLVAWAMAYGTAQTVALFLVPLVMLCGRHPRLLGPGVVLMAAWILYHHMTPLQSVVVAAIVLTPLLLIVGRRMPWRRPFQFLVVATALSLAYLASIGGSLHATLAIIGRSLSETAVVGGSIVSVAGPRLPPLYILWLKLPLAAAIFVGFLLAIDAWGQRRKPVEVGTSLVGSGAAMTYAVEPMVAFLTPAIARLLRTDRFALVGGILLPLMLSFGALRRARVVVAVLLATCVLAVGSAASDRLQSENVLRGPAPPPVVTEQDWTLVQWGASAQAHEAVVTDWQSGRIAFYGFHVVRMASIQAPTVAEEGQLVLARQATAASSGLYVEGAFGFEGTHRFEVPDRFLRVLDNGPSQAAVVSLA